MTFFHHLLDVYSELHGVEKKVASKLSQTHLKPLPSGSLRGEFTIKVCYAAGQLILIACIASPDSCSFLLPFGAYHNNRKQHGENYDMTIANDLIGI